jgi:hypothetical protein
MSKILVYPGSKWQMNNYRGVDGTKTPGIKTLSVKTRRVKSAFS